MFWFFIGRHGTSRDRKTAESESTSGLYYTMFIRRFRLKDNKFKSLGCLKSSFKHLAN